MRKIVLSLCFILLLGLFISGCDENVTPLNVSFKNQTYLGSENYCITPVYAEDKRIRDKYTDIYIQTDTPNTVLKVAKELGNSYEITISESEKWYSLTNLFMQKLDLATFATVETTTFIINSYQKVNLKIKAVGGDLVYHINTGENSLTNQFDVSKVLELKIEKTIKNA